MKKFLFALICLSFATPAFAGEEKDAPCKKIKAACEAAGYTKGGHKTDSKGLHIDCLQKLKEGQAVEGVSVSAEDMAACKEKKEKHKAKKAAKSQTPAAE